MYFTVLWCQFTVCYSDNDESRTLPIVQELAQKLHSRHYSGNECLVIRSKLGCLLVGGSSILKLSMKSEFMYRLESVRYTRGALFTARDTNLFPVGILLLQVELLLDLSTNHWTTHAMFHNVLFCLYLWYFVCAGNGHNHVSFHRKLQLHLIYGQCFVWCYQISHYVRGK